MNMLSVMHSRTANLINNTVPNIIVIVYIAHRLLHKYQILTAVFNSYAMGMSGLPDIYT